ncbi:MAG: amylo-alpha-1,6-glucosidase [Sphingomonadales bacterium 32-67-7]|nr:MAG: amylo-alpha-1,6-glucosidase [Sphingomonadales bacterium 32-67-7]
MSQPQEATAPVDAGPIDSGPVDAGPHMSQAQLQFFIPATASLHERRPRTLKHGESFAVFDHSGDAISGPGSPEGLYHRDTRHLSHLYLTMNGARPILLSSALRDDNLILTCDLTNPDFADKDGHILTEHDLIHLRRSRFLWEGSVYERITLRNFDLEVHRLTIGLSFAADFALLRYRGLDERERQTHFHFFPRPDQLTDSIATFDVVLQPGERTYLFLRVCCEENRRDGPLPQQFLKALRETMQGARQARHRAGSVHSSNQLFNEVTRRAVADITMLSTQTRFGPYPYAGIPWFSTVFGRDALITALQTLWLDPAISRGVLGYLALHQATTFDAASDAEPGKILHEVRHGEMAELGEVPFRHYYGSIDSTPLFVMLAGAYLDRTGDTAFLEEIRPNIEAALRWIDTHGDRDGDGFVEYGRFTDQGLINQGWKDSHDSVFHADGQLARGPIALAEVQAYVHGAWTTAAALFTLWGEDERASGYRERAERLRDAFDQAFFDEHLGTYVLALDGAKQPCRVRSSNAGHVLFTGLAKDSRVDSVVRTLMAPSSFSGWGIRTIASTEARYNPMSYHNGSVWPHDNALIAAGFARYGYRQEAKQIFEGLFAAASYVDHMRLPELFCGFPRRRAQGPTFYPVACSPQAWAAATPLAIIQSCLGLKIDAAARQVRLHNPTLPRFLNDLTLQGLPIGDDRLDIVLERRAETVIARRADHKRDIEVVVTC